MKETSPQSILRAFLQKGGVSLSMILNELEDDYNLEAFARWSIRGIPRKHWDLLKKLSKGKITPQNCYDFSVERRRETLKKS